jgi:hypothetical protein
MERYLKQYFTRISRAAQTHRPGIERIRPAGNLATIAIEDSIAIQ